MTNSDLDAAADAQAGPLGKRERLIAAACQRVYEQGAEKTTLADIATAAGVPLGNVYYYFKTKNDLLQAVVEAHLREVGAILAALEAAHAAPRDRLKALFGALAEQRALIARYGCPHGTLCLELDKRADGPGLAAELMRVPLEWTQRQFEAMGRPDARDLAFQVVARYQGTTLLTNTFRDPDLMTREAARVAQWIDALDLPAHGAAIRAPWPRVIDAGGYLAVRSFVCCTRCPAPDGHTGCRPGGRAARAACRRAASSRRASSPAS